MRKKGDVNKFECGVVVGAKQAGLSVSKPAGSAGIFPTQTSAGFAEHGLKKRKHPVLSSLGENTSMMSEGRGESTRVPLLSAETRKLGLQFASDEKNISWSDECGFLLRQGQNLV